MIAGPDATGLQGGSHGLRLVVELGPGDGDPVVTTDERDGAVSAGGDLDALGQCLHGGYDYPAPAAVTSLSFFFGFVGLRTA